MIKLRKLLPKDLNLVSEIGRASFTEPWPKKEFEKYLDSSFVAEDGNKIAGFAVTKIAKNQGVLKLIAANHDFRGRGVGKSLMEHIFKYFREKGVKKITARSRLHNKAGCAFLKSFGFDAGKIIKNYYRNGEDAYLMKKTLDG